MDGAFEDVRFLANSENRSAVLGIVAEGPVSREEILAQVDASRVTLRRILGEFEDRGWVERGDEGFATTAAGSVVATEFEASVDAMRAVHTLEGVIEWLPVDVLGFEVGRLADAQVTRPGSATTIAPVERVDELVRDAEEAVVLSAGVSASTVAANRDAVVEDGQQFAGVIGRPALGAIHDSEELSRPLRAMLETGHAELAVATEPVPHMMLAVLDDTVVFGLLGEGLPRGVVESDDPEVRRWAENALADHRAAAEPVSAADLES